MNAKKAKMIRKALRQLSNEPAQYVTKAPKVKLFERPTINGVELAQALVVQPIRLKPGSKRLVYQTMKLMECTTGLDRVFKELEGEINETV